MQALDFHKQVLASINVKDVNEDGYLTAFPDKDIAIPVSIGGKRLVLPTRDILKASPWDECVGFNPFSERLTRGESPILKFTKDAISLRLNGLFGQLFAALALVASDSALQKRMGPKVGELLKSCPEANEKTLQKAKKLVDIVHRQPQHNFISMYLRHGGENGASRTCVVSFPIYEALCDDEATEIVGLKLTSAKDKDKARLKGLFEYIIGEMDSYTYGSDSQAAPYYHSLLTSFNLLATRLNGVAVKHKKVIEGADDMKIDTLWAEGLNDFDGFNGQIPSLEGNEGVVLADTKDDKRVEAAKATVFSRDNAKLDEGPRETRTRDREDRDSRDDRDDRSSRRSRDSENSVMDEFRNQFRRQEEEERSSSWGRREERDTWGRRVDSRDRDRGRERESRSSSRRANRRW